MTHRLPQRGEAQVARARPEQHHQVPRNVVARYAVLLAGELLVQVAHERRRRHEVLVEVAFHQAHEALARRRARRRPPPAREGKEVLVEREKVVVRGGGGEVAPEDGRLRCAVRLALA